LDWSFALLPKIEQVLLSRLAVFRNSFSRQAAIEVASSDELGTEVILDGLTNLLEKSLIVSSLRDGRNWYRLLDTTRAYAIEKLREGNSSSDVYRRYVAYCSTEANRIRSAAGENDAGQFQDSRLLVDEIRAALSWSFSPLGEAALGLELTVASSFIWYQLSLLDEYRMYAERALESLKNRPDRTPAEEMELLVVIGPALYNTVGPITGVGEAFSRALVIAQQSHDEHGQLRALRGLWQYRYALGQHADALATIEEFGSIAGLSDDQTYLFHAMSAITHLYRGELAIARRHATDILQFSKGHKLEPLVLYDYDRVSFAHVVLSRILWLQGFPSQALDHAQASVEEAITTKHSLSICFACAIAACPVALWAGKLSMARHNLQILEEYSTRSALAHWHRYGEVYARALELGAQYRPGIIGLPLEMHSKWSPKHIEEFSVLGEGFAPADLISRPFSNDSFWGSAEILRLEAARLLHAQTSKASDQAATLLTTSLEISRQQGALSWELRTSNSLAQLWLQQGRDQEARELLRSVLSQFSEGFETVDYTRATALLKTIESE
jgi:hypothetical protein